MSRPLRALCAAAVAVAVMLPLGGAAAAEPGDGRVLHRVVWDQWKRNDHGGGGIHISSAKVDGSGVRHVYDSDVGFTMELTLDPRGRRVAFALCCRPGLPVLLVAPVMGGRTREPLARHRQIRMVDTVAWSPNGERLVFVGGVWHEDHTVFSLWTVGVDGTGLRRILGMPSGEDQYGFVSLVWTRTGILYTDGRRLARVDHGTSEVVLRHASVMQVSGDHRHLLIARRWKDGSSLWLARPDGTLQRRLQWDPVREPGSPGIGFPTPSFDATSLLAQRSRPAPDGYSTVSETVWWKTADGQGSASVLGWIPKNWMSMTWN